MAPLVTHNSVLTVTSWILFYKNAVSKLSATATATARFLHYLLLKYSMSLATSFATVRAATVAVNLETVIQIFRLG